MNPVPQPPADMMDMSPVLQEQFLMMQYLPVALTAALCIWAAYKHKSLVPVFLFLGGGLAYLAEPLVNVLGLVWFPPNGIQAVWESIGRPVPLFGFLAYAWFLGGMAVLVYDRMTKGITMLGLWKLYGILVIVECLLEIPGLNIGAFTYYGPQPYVLFKFPVWFAFCNAAGPMVAGALVYRMLPHIKSYLQPITIYAVPFSNAAVMFAAGLPLYFFMNRSASLAVTHIAGAVTIATACFFVYMVTLAAGKDSPARTAPTA